jgi:UDP-2-acetamido-3-amino-2,3-dideoxy-glucuronate N-acetyltransferase
MDPYIHPTAIVEDDVVIGPGTSVWHHGHVRRGAVIGSGCTLGKNVFVDAGVRIGDGVKIQNNVSVYAGVTIDDDVFVGPSAVFTNDLHPRAFAVDWSVTPTVVHRGASIGANATIVCGVHIGGLALIGSGAVVTRSVAAHQLVLGNPARPCGWVCTCGRTVPTADGSEPSPDVICTACALPWRRGLPLRGDVT